MGIAGQVLAQISAINRPQPALKKNMAFQLATLMRRNEVQGHGAQGRAPADPDAAAAIVLFIEEARHEPHQRGPHKGLGKAIDAPHGGDGGGVGTQGNQQVHSRGQEQAEEHQIPGLHPVTQPAADELACAVGDEGTGNGSGKGGFFIAVGKHHLIDHRAEIHPGEIAHHIGRRQQPDIPADSLFICNLFHSPTWLSIVFPKNHSTVWGDCQYQA